MPFDVGIPELVVLLVLFVAPVVLVARIAARKGHSVALFVVLGVLFSWLAVLVAAVMPARTEPSTNPQGGLTP